MSAPRLKPITERDRALWQKHNIETLREWRAIPFDQKLRMVEEMEDLARSMRGGKLPAPPSARGQALSA